MGIRLGSAIFAVHTGASIAKVFFITAATFSGASIIGYTTKRDLTGSPTFIYGSIRFNYCNGCEHILVSPPIQFAISIIGVFIFTGLTAWDTPKCKTYIFKSWRRSKYGIQFAISLYLNFINLFQMLLALLGNRE